MNKRIWILNHYAGTMFFSNGGRHYCFAKYLKNNNYEPTVFCANSKHNDADGGTYFPFDGLWTRKENTETSVPYVFIKARSYRNNGVTRIMNMIDFYHNVLKTAKQYAKVVGEPDVILASSVHPLTLLAGIKLARLFKIKCICEIRDLWPESLISYGIINRYNPIAIILRCLEKWIYVKADAIVFTMGGGYKYIEDQNWDSIIPQTKVTQINNGVDLEVFNYNRIKYQIEDPELDDPSTFKIVYTGSLRRANEQILRLFDAIELMQGPKWKDYKFFIYGKGDLLSDLKMRCENKHLTNVSVKGFISKDYIPFVLSKCDIGILNCLSHEILKYGGSQNKQFEYFAAGIPVITSEDNAYSIVKNRNCGVAKDFQSPDEIVDAIVSLRNNPISHSHILSVAEEYDYNRLTKRLLDIIDKCISVEKV